MHVTSTVEINSNAGDQTNRVLQQHRIDLLHLFNVFCGRFSKNTRLMDFDHIPIRVLQKDLVPPGDSPATVV
jgi:hypothetical protein